MSVLGSIFRKDVSDRHGRPFLYAGLDIQSNPLNVLAFV